MPPKPQQQACAFCDILSGTVPASFAYEEESLIAILDQRQPHRGHVLVIPRTHVQTVYDLDEATASSLMTAAVRIARAVREAFAPEGLSLWQSNGPAAFQEVPHVHVHVMPRFLGDGLLRVYPSRPATPDRTELDTQAAAVRHALTGRSRDLVPPDSSILIRSFKPADQQAARGIIEDALTRRWGVLDPSRNPDLDDLGSWYADDTLLVATVEGAVVGVGCLIRHGEEGRIVRLYVAPRVQRTGVGTALLDELLRAAMNQGLSIVRAETTASWSDARRFYERHGFRLEREDEHDAHYMLNPVRSKRGSAGGTSAP